ncbi:MAG: hypothetical protein AB2761_20700 [Candidatus Thiodiazotropha endolucinida]
MKCIKPLIRLIATIILLNLFMGCTANAPYHIVRHTEGNCRNLLIDSSNCRNSYYQEYDHYDLAFAEFTDRGNTFSDTIINDILEKVREKVDDDGAIIIVFVHGWKHNSHELDENLNSFKRTLSFISKNISNVLIGERRVIGLYIGWRGASFDIPLFDNLTFWTRQDVAEDVGDGGVNRLIMNLDAIIEQRDQSAMVVIGHSFGGAMVVAALTEILADRFSQYTRSNKEIANGVGDAVIVLNPAIQANKILPLIDIAVNAQYQPQQPPIFISLSSDDDLATHLAFPIGQVLASLTGPDQLSISRSYLYDRADTTRQVYLNEKDLDNTTVGNYAPFLTHRILATKTGSQIQVSVNTCDDVPEECALSAQASIQGFPAIKAPKHFPLYFFKTDRSIMRGHGDMFNARTMAFIVCVIVDAIKLKSQHKIQALGSAKSIFSDLTSLEHNMEYILNYSRD